jgi:adenosylcobinamide-phosphate synthase
MIQHILAVILAVALDKVLGDPRWLPHPVRGMGGMIYKLEPILNKGKYRVQKGTITAFIVTFISVLITLFIIKFSYTVHISFGIIIEAFLIYTTIAEKNLGDAAMEVYYPLADDDLEKAREKLGWIVGRDTEKLDEQEIVRGVVETVAENTSDGVTAPIFYAIIGGAPLAFFYRAVNTLDSMLGYKNERYLLFGRASAKWDDWMNFIPSRITGFCMVVSNLNVSVVSFRACIKILLRDARKHPSPNSGWGEAAMAAILGVQLGGTNTYKGLVSIRAKMGNPTNLLQKNHILESIGIMKRTVFLFTLLMIIGGFLYELSSTWS